MTNGSNGEAACTTSVTVSEIAPTVECPDKLTKSVGREVSATPKSLTGCTNGCNWTLKDVNSQVKSGTIKNGEGFSFIGESSEGTKTYTLEVSNIKGSANCSFDVEYVENANVDVKVTYGSYVPFVAGKCYNVTLDRGNMFRCTFVTSSAFKVGIFNGTDFYATANSG